MDVRRLITASLLCGIAGCATVETAADHARDFVHQHPAVVAAGAVVIMASIEASQSHHTHAPVIFLKREPHQSPCTPQGLTPC